MVKLFDKYIDDESEYLQENFVIVERPEELRDHVKQLNRTVHPTHNSHSRKKHQKSWKPIVCEGHHLCGLIVSKLKLGPAYIDLLGDETRKSYRSVYGDKSQS